jgi:hypothetical protein
MASSIITSDIDAMFNDPFHSVAIVFGAQSCRGDFDWDDAIQNDGTGDVFVRRRKVTVRTGALTTLTNGLAITVDGVTYRIHDSQKVGDGQLTEIILAA